VPDRATSVSLKLLSGPQALRHTPFEHRRDHWVADVAPDVPVPVAPAVPVLPAGCHAVEFAERVVVHCHGVSFPWSGVLPIDRVFPLEEVVDAYRHLMRGHARGKVVLGLA